ncbi:WD repeat domain phosphoinositide-interacting protein 4 [Orchesella cincta]|uniref:WD repeat domain phosphoinositide-interacting protein 4 n=1 Tax=Orchesella cincta TaxID=48709 RepID=A0A1D2MIH4_ORCCI|nr:WD repeat domain phosphoinositide-interacting protein 4 [Orchesella cincta]
MFKGCFYVCLNDGLRIYNVEPLVEKMHLDNASVGSIVHCEMVYRCNLFAIVGGGQQPKYASNAVLIYDDIRKRPVLEFAFAQPVLSIKCRRDRLVAVLKTEVHIFSFPNHPKKLFSVSTRSNPHGLCELSPGIKNVVVFPGLQVGSVEILDLSKPEWSDPSSGKTPANIHAHQGELACFSINNSGSLIATASDKGTLIRVWDLLKLVLLNELRVGFSSAILHSINFSVNSDLLCCSVDVGNIHIFDLKTTHLNRPSTWGFFGKYMESQWALANFTVTPECVCICAFESDSSVVALCKDGTIHRYAFTSGGESRRLSFDAFLDICGDEGL